MLVKEILTCNIIKSLQFIAFPLTNAWFVLWLKKMESVSGCDWTGLQLQLHAICFVVIQLLTVTTHTVIYVMMMLLFKYTEIHIKCLRSESRQNQMANRNSSADTEVVAAGGWFNWKMTKALQKDVLVQENNQKQPVESPVAKRRVADGLQTGCTHWCRLIAECCL